MYPTIQKHKLKNMNKSIPDNARVIDMTVIQIKEIMEGILKESASLLSGNKPEIIGIEEVEELTGYKKPTIYKLIHERRIPSHKPSHGGRKLFFKRSEIEKWLQYSRIETNEEFFQNYRKNNKTLILENKIAKLEQQLIRLKILINYFRHF